VRISWGHGSANSTRNRRSSAQSAARKEVDGLTDSRARKRHLGRQPAFQPGKSFGAEFEGKTRKT
jgi:hypothetical protein